VNRADKKKKLAIYTATGCRACEQGILDLNYEVSNLARYAEPVFWPYLLGTPWEAPDEGEVDAYFFAGAIRTEADRQAALGKPRLLSPQRRRLTNRRRFWPAMISPPPFIIGHYPSRMNSRWPVSPSKWARRRW